MKNITSSIYSFEKLIRGEAEESEENAKYLAALTELVIDEDGCIIYDLRDGSWEMFDGSVEDIEGLYVVAYEAEADTDTDVDVLVIFE